MPASVDSCLVAERPLTEPHPSRLPLDHPRRADILAAHAAALEDGKAGLSRPGDRPLRADRRLPGRPRHLLWSRLSSLSVHRWCLTSTFRWLPPSKYGVARIIREEAHVRSRLIAAGAVAAVLALAGCNRLGQTRRAAPGASRRAARGLGRRRLHPLGLRVHRGDDRRPVHRRGRSTRSTTPSTCVVQTENGPRRRSCILSVVDGQSADAGSSPPRCSRTRPPRSRAWAGRLPAGRQGRRGHWARASRSAGSARPSSCRR